MAKKFFYNRVYNTRRTIINLIIIGVCIIGVIICFIVVSNTNLQGGDSKEPGGNLSIKEETTIEVNEEYTKEIFFSKIENVDLDKIEIIYPTNYSSNVIGTYDVTIRINNKNYSTKLTVVDTVMPTLKLKELTISPNATYNANDFVESCTDNSGNDCIISFYQNGTDEDGKNTDYSQYTKEGTYSIKISAKDKANNESVSETKLIIQKNGTSTPKPPVGNTCKYGNNVYDTNEYLLAKDISTNGCAISLDLYNDTQTTLEINKMMETETTRIKKDIENLNISGTNALIRTKRAIVNKAGSGIVGYELEFIVTITNQNKVETVAQYKLNSAGKRIFTINPYKLNQ